MMSLQEAQTISRNGYDQHAVVTFDLAESKLRDAGDAAAANRCKRKAARARQENTAKRGELASPIRSAKLQTKKENENDK